MDKLFINKEHKNRLKDMIKADKTISEDMERISLFYIIAENDDLYRKRSFIYDTDKHSIYPDFEELDVDFSSSIKSLIKLGYNLYNGWSDKNTTPLRLLGSLDNDNFKLANGAMMARFNNDWLG